MANMGGFDSGVEVIRRNPQLGAGIHLNIIRGRPVLDTDTVYPLLDTDGRFITNIFQIGRLTANPDYLQAAEQEYRAQIEKVLAADIQPDHLDFEKHHGIWQNLYRIGISLATEYKLSIRSYNEPLFFALQNLPFPGYRNFWKSLHLKFYNSFFHRNFTTPMPDYFFGQTHIGKIDRDFLLALSSSLPEGISELMTHPGYNLTSVSSQLDLGNSWITEKRTAELAALKDPAVLAAFTKTDIEITTFREGLFRT